LLSYRERVESTGHVYVWRAKGVRVGGFAWLTGVLGLPGPTRLQGQSERCEDLDRDGR
jgi:hypothetical protein